jgi:UDP:flavonoid glycosyltransferase YjiC (YdhE family)
LGSAGDVHPFAGLGAEFVARGYRATLITSGVFSRLAEDEGFEFREVMSVAEYQAAAADPDLWDPRKSYGALYKRMILPAMRNTYRAVAEVMTPGETIVIAPGYAIGARIACEKFGLPLITCHLAPLQFRSGYQNRHLAGATLPDWLPPWLKRASFWIGDRVSDAIAGPGVNGFRAELGLPPVRRIIWDWWNSPQLILGMFPEWFATPQIDWPRQTRLTGFPLYDGKSEQQLLPELERFLDADAPPIVFTLGTAMAHAAEFFRTSILACQELGRRGVLISRFADQLPESLPDGFIAVDHAPFQSLLPRAAALVHHGGIGSSAQAIAAGIPQLVRPMSADQPDNAYRLCRLGVAVQLMPKKYHVKAVTEAIQHLTTSLDVRASCRRWAREVCGPKAICQACDYVEQMMASAILV